MKYLKIVLAAFLSLITLIGSTFAIMYFTGSFDKDSIRPQDIYFNELSYALDYDIDGNYVAFATVMSDTTGVTEKGIMLSLVSDSVDMFEVDETHISDGVVIVPRRVLIGQPFMIRPYLKLYGTEVGDVNYDPEFEDGWSWIAGGVSSLKAESTSNVLLSAAFSQVLVDIPVRNILVQTYSGSNQTTNFAVGSIITLQAKFFPAESENALGVKKNVLYEIKNQQANILDFVQDSNAFNVGGTMFYNKIAVYAQTNENLIDIEAYTFKTIKEQARAVAEAYEVHQLLLEMDATRTSLKDQMPEGESEANYLLSFLEPKISHFEIDAGWTQYNKINLPFNKLIALYANNANILNDTATNEFDLGLLIHADNGQELPGKTSNIVMIPESSIDGITWFYDDGNITGVNNKVQVLNTQLVSIVLEDEIIVSGYRVNNIGAWNLVGEQQSDYFRFRIVYLKEDGTLLLNEQNQVMQHAIYFTVPSVNTNVTVSWTDSKPELLEIKKSENPGETTYPSFDLRAILAISPSNAVYQTVRYFVKGHEDNAFDVSQIVDATYYGQIEGVDVYELNPYANGIITGRRSGKISVFAAIIKTDYAGRPVYNEGGGYAFAGSTTDKAFEFNELISILNATLVAGWSGDGSQLDLNAITQETDEAILVRIELPEHNKEAYKATFIDAYNSGDLQIWSNCLTVGENALLNLLEFQAFVNDVDNGIFGVLFNVKRFPDEVTRDDLTFRINISYTANPHVQINYFTREFKVISGLAGGVFFEVTRNEDGSQASFGISPESRIYIEAAFSQTEQSYTITSNGQDVKTRLFKTVDIGGVSSLTTIPLIGFANQNAHGSYQIYTIVSSDPSVAEVKTRSEGNNIIYYLEYKASDANQHNFTLTVRLSSLKENDKFQTIYLSYRGPNAVWETDLVDNSITIYGNINERVDVPFLLRLTNNLEGELREDYTSQFVTFNTNFSQDADNSAITIEFNKELDYNGVTELYKGVTYIQIKSYIWQELKIVINCSTEFGFFRQIEIVILPCIVFSTSLQTIASENFEDPNSLPVAYASTSHQILVYANNATKNGVVQNAFYDDLQMRIAEASRPTETLAGGPFQTYARPSTDQDIFRYFLNPSREGTYITTPYVELFFGAVDTERVLRIFFTFSTISGFEQYIDIVLRPNIVNTTIPLNASPNAMITNNLNEGGVEFYSGDSINLVSQAGLNNQPSSDALSFSRGTLLNATNVISGSTYNFDINNVSFKWYAFSAGNYIELNSEQLYHNYGLYIAYDALTKTYILQVNSSLKIETLFRIDFIYAGGEAIPFQFVALPNLKAIGMVEIDNGGTTVLVEQRFEQTLYNGEYYHKLVAVESGIDFAQGQFINGIDFLTNSFSQFVDVDGVLKLQNIDKQYLSAEIVESDISINQYRIVDKNLFISSSIYEIKTFNVIISKYNASNELIGKIVVKFLILPYDIERMINYTDTSLQANPQVNLSDLSQVLNNSQIYGTYEGGSGTVNLLTPENDIDVLFYLDLRRPENPSALYQASFSIVSTQIEGLSISPNGDFVCPALSEVIVVHIRVRMALIGTDVFTFDVRIRVNASLSPQVLYPYSVGQETAEWRIMSGNSLTIHLNEKFTPDVPAYLAGNAVANGKRQRIMFFSNQSTYMSELALTYSIHEVWNEVNEDGLYGVKITNFSSIASITANGTLTVNKQQNVNSVKVIIKATTIYDASVYYTVIVEVEPSANYLLTGPTSLDIHAGVAPINLVAKQGEEATDNQFSLFNNSEFIIGDVTDELGFYVVNPSNTSFMLDASNNTLMRVSSQVPINPIQKNLVVYTKYGTVRTVSMILKSDFSLHFNNNYVGVNQVNTMQAYSGSTISLINLMKLFDMHGNEAYLKDTNGVVSLNNYNISFDKTTYYVPSNESAQPIFELENDAVKIGEAASFTINPLISEEVVRITAAFWGTVTKRIGLSEIALYSGTIETSDPLGETLTSLAFESLPKRAYFQGDEITYDDFANLKLVGIYSDGIARRITAPIDTLIKTLPDALKTGSQHLIIEYEDKTIQLDIVVISKNENLNFTPLSFNISESHGDLQAIHIKKLPNNVSYFVGDTISVEGLEIVGEYHDSGNMTFSILEGWGVSANLAVASARQEVTVSFGDFTTSFYIEVIDPFAQNTEEIVINSSDPIYLTLDLMILPNITPNHTQLVDFLLIETYSNRDEMYIPFETIFNVHQPEMYEETSDTSPSANKAYFTKSGSVFVRFTGTQFAAGTTYYTVKPFSYETTYEIVSGATATINLQEVRVISLHDLPEDYEDINKITNRAQALVLNIHSVASEHTVTIRVKTQYEHITTLRIKIYPEVAVAVNYPGVSLTNQTEETSEMIYYKDYETNAFDLRQNPLLFNNKRVQAYYASGTSQDLEIATTRFEIAKISFTDYLGTTNEYTFLPGQQEATFEIGAFELLVNKYGSFTVTGFNPLIYYPTTITLYIYVDGISRIDYNVTITNVHVYSFDAFLTNPERIENGKELFATKPTVDDELLFTEQTVGIGKKYAVKYLGINIESLNNFDSSYLTKIFVTGYPITETVNMSVFAIRSGVFTPSSGASLQFSFANGTTWATTHQIKVVPDYLIRNTTINVYAGVEVDIIQAAQITERFSYNLISKSDLTIYGTDITEVNSLWFTYIEDFKTFRAKHVNGIVERKMSIELYSGMGGVSRTEEITVNVIQTAQINLVDRTFSEVYFYDNMHQPVSSVVMDLYESPILSNFLELDYTNGASNPNFEGGEEALSYSIVMFDLFGKLLDSTSGQTYTNPFGFISGNSITFIKPMFTRQPVVLRVTHDEFVQDFIFYVSATDTDIIVFQDNDIDGYYEGDDLPTVKTSSYPYVYDPSASWTANYNDSNFEIKYRSETLSNLLVWNEALNRFEVGLLGSEFFRNGDNYADRIEQIIVTVSLTYTGALGEITEEISAITSVYIKQRFVASFVYASGDTRIVRNGVEFTPQFHIYDEKEDRYLTRAEVGLVGTQKFVHTTAAETLFATTYETGDLSANIVRPYAIDINLTSFGNSQIKFVVFANYKVAPIYSQISRINTGTTVDELFSQWNLLYNFNYKDAGNSYVKEIVVDNSKLYFELTKGSADKVYVDQWGNVTGLWNVDSAAEQVVVVRERLTGYVIATLTFTRKTSIDQVSYLSSSNPIFATNFYTTILAHQFRINGAVIDAEGISFNQFSGFASSLITPALNGTSKEYVTIFIKQGAKVIPVGFVLSNHSSEMFYTETVTVGEETGLKINGLKSSVAVSHLIIPDTLNGQNVIAIGDNAFINNTSITSIKMGANVITIGKNAFKGNTNLSSVILYSLQFDPNGNVTNSYYSNLKTIDDSAFENCTNLRVIDIPSSVTTIGKKAFKGCTNLQTVGLSKQASALTIGDDAFANCSSLTQMYLPNGLTTLNSGVFSGCTSLISFVVENDHPRYSVLDGNLFNKYLTTFIQYAPGNVRESFTLPGLVTEIADGAFKGASYLKSIIIRNIVKTIGDYAFAEIGGGDIVTITFETDSKIESIGFRAFYNIAGTARIYLNTNNPPILKGLDGEGLNEGIELIDVESGSLPTRSIYVENREAYKNKESKGWTDGLMNYLVEAPTDAKYFITTEIAGEIIIIGLTSGGKELKSISIPPSIRNKNVVAINTAVFFSNENIEELFIPNSITAIAANAFENCINLKTVEFEGGSTLSEFNNNLFKGCISLKSVIYAKSAKDMVTIPFSVTSIGQNVFNGCIEITKVVIPAELVSIDSTALINCPKLAQFDMSDGEENAFTISADKRAIIENLGAQIKLRFFATASSAKFIIPSDVTIVDEYAFYKAQLSDIATNDNLHSINAYAFAMSKLSTLILPKNINHIGSSAFDKCYDLVSILLQTSYVLTPSQFGGLASVATLAFDLTNAASKTIGNFSQFLAFSPVSSIAILRADAVSPFAFMVMKGSLVLDNGINFIYIASDSGLISIGEAAFKKSQISSISLPDTLTSISPEAFSDCYNLQSLTLPKNISYVGGKAFAYNTQLKTLTLQSSTFIPTVYMFSNNGVAVVQIEKLIFNYSGSMPETSYTPFVNGVSSIKTIQLDKNITSIGANLIGCVNVSKFEVASGGSNYSTIDNNLYYGTNLVRFALGSSQTSFVLANSTTQIAISAFEKSKLLYLTIPATSNLSTINNYAFKDSNIFTVYLYKAFSSFTVGLDVFNVGANVIVYLQFDSYEQYRERFEINNNTDHVRSYLKPIVDNNNLTLKNNFITPFNENISYSTMNTVYGFELPNRYGSSVELARIVIGSTFNDYFKIFRYHNGILTEVAEDESSYIVSFGVKHYIQISRSYSFSINFHYETAELFGVTSFYETQYLNYIRFVPDENKGYFASNNIEYWFDRNNVAPVQIYDEFGNSVSSTRLTKNTIYYLLTYPTGGSSRSLTINISSAMNVSNYSPNVVASKVVNTSVFYRFVAPETATFVFQAYAESNTSRRIALYDSTMSFLNVANGSTPGSAYISRLLTSGTVIYIGIDNRYAFGSSSQISWSITRYIVQSYGVNDMYFSKTLVSENYASYVTYVKFTPSSTRSHSYSRSVSSGSITTIFYNYDFSSTVSGVLTAGSDYYLRITTYTAAVTITLQFYYTNIGMNNFLTIYSWKTVTRNQGSAGALTYYFIATKKSHSIEFADLTFILSDSRQKLYNNDYTDRSTGASWSGLTVGKVYIIDVWFYSLVIASETYKYRIKGN